MVTMAEKMQSALLITAHPARYGCDEIGSDKEIRQTQINIGAGFEQWRQVGHVEGLKSDAEVDLFLLDR